MAPTQGSVFHYRLVFSRLRHPVRSAFVYCITHLILRRGWDNTGANGANLSFPVEFGIEDNSWLVGFINSA